MFGFFAVALWDKFNNTDIVDFISCLDTENKEVFIEYLLNNKKFN